MFHKLSNKCQKIEITKSARQKGQISFISQIEQINVKNGDNEECETNETGASERNRLWNIIWVMW